MLLPWNFAQVATLFSTLLKDLFYHEITCVTFINCVAQGWSDPGTKFSLSPCLQPMENDGAKQNLNELNWGNARKETPKGSRTLTGGFKTQPFGQSTVLLKYHSGTFLW